MESSVAPLPHRRSHRTYRSLLHHLCSSFDREPRVSLATPFLLQELVLRTEITQESPGETEKPPENPSRSDGGCGEKVEMISKELMLGDVFDGIDLQDASLGNQHNNFFDDFELMIDVSQDIVPENCVNLFEALDVNDYGHDGMAKQALDLEKPNIVTETEVQVDTVDGDKKVSEVPKSVESNQVISSGVSENNNEALVREMELEKPVNSSQVLEATVSHMVEDDDDVEEGEISGDDYMLIGDDLQVEESHVSQQVSDLRGEGTSKSSGSNLFSGLGSVSTPDTGKKLGVEGSNVDNGPKKSDQTSNNKEKLDSGTSIKKRSAPSKEAKARKKANARKKRAQERIALGVKKLKLKPVAPKPKPIKYCRHFLKGRCHEGDKCKFSHDTIPETKSSPCCYFATQSCMNGDDCPYDHDLSKYPCKNFITNGSCRRGDNCLFSHKGGTPQSTSDRPRANVTNSSTNMAQPSCVSPQKSNKPTVREAIAKLPTIQARVSNPVAFLKPSSQSNKRNSSDASSSPKINEHVTPPQILPLRKPSVTPKGMSFLSLDKTSKLSLGIKQNMEKSDTQSLKPSQDRSILPVVPPKGTSFVSFASEEHKALNQEPQEPASSRNLKTRPNSHIQTSLNSAMKLAAEFEFTKVERCTNDQIEAVNKSNVTMNTSISRNSGNVSVSSKILEFLSSFSHGKN